MAESSLVPAQSSGIAAPEAGESPVTGDDPVTAESEKARFDRLVDAVVDRIEQRVVDELERRGRRQDWRVF